MLVTQKMQYALRAVYELAKRRDEGPLKTAQIAEAQAIPVRFLEVILNRLKREGLITAKRGFYGGYQLKRSPRKVSVGDVFRAIEGNPDATGCISCINEGNCPFQGECSFIPLWLQVQKAIDEIYDHTTIQCLLNHETSASRELIC
jgi:Rrf2 family protein